MGELHYGNSTQSFSVSMMVTGDRAVTQLDLKETPGLIIFNDQEVCFPAVLGSNIGQFKVSDAAVIP